MTIWSRGYPRGMQVSSRPVLSVQSSVVVSMGGRGCLTLRRRPQSMRRTSTVWAVSDFPMSRGRDPQSAASWSWYSSSEVDLMLMSRKRAKSLELFDPHPSTILNATDSAALTIWNLSDPRSLRGNLRIARRTPSTSSWDFCHTRSRRKSCMLTTSFTYGPGRRPFPACLHESALTENHRRLITHQLTTQDLHPPSRTPNSPQRYPGRLR